MASPWARYRYTSRWPIQRYTSLTTSTGATRAFPNGTHGGTPSRTAASWSIPCKTPPTLGLGLCKYDHIATRLAGTERAYGQDMRRPSGLSVPAICVSDTLDGEVPGTKTISRGGEDGRGKVTRRHYLFVEFDCERPLRPPVRFNLTGVSEVAIGRGEGADIESIAEVSERKLLLRFPDDRMSSDHARLRKVGRSWVLEDTKSKNGSFVNGVGVTDAALADGDVVELGHTFMLYGTALVPNGPEATILSAGDVAHEELGLATLSPSLAPELRALEKVAISPSPIVLLGETGTGKEVIARAAHAVSGRTGKFVAVNCGALPRELVESELFGHRKGAFSGATEDREGRVRTAAGGTLFLDEIGDLPEAMQVKFLRVLQDRKVTRVGDSEPVSVDFRLIAATNRDLAGQVAAGHFRADLYARISAYTVVLPPLRERREDLGLLFGKLLHRIAGARASSVRLTYELARALLMYDWPHNIRELENYLTPALALADDDVLRLEYFPEAVRKAAVRVQRPASDEDQRKQLVALLAQHRGNVSAVARALGKTRTQIHRLAKRFAIDFETFRE